MIIYIFIHIYYLTLPLGNHLSYILKPTILVPSSVLTAVVRQSLPAKQWLTQKLDGFLLLNVRILVPSNEYSDGSGKTIVACETVVDRNFTGSLLSMCNVMKC
jgi:hypothetical protein